MEVNFRSHEQLSCISGLSDQWIKKGNSLAILKGFPGVGKKTVSYLLAQQVKRKALFLTLDADSEDPVSSMYFDLASNLESLENNKARQTEIGQSSILELTKEILSRDDLLITFDNLELLIDNKGLIKSKGLASLFSDLSRSPRYKSKILLLTTRSPKTDSWNESAYTHTLKGLSPTEGSSYLFSLVKRKGLLEKLPKEKCESVARRLGGNFRAILTFVNAGLEFESLEHLMSWAPEEFSPGDDTYSQELLEEFERTILTKAQERLSETERSVLNFCSLFRRSFSRSFFKFLDDRDIVSDGENPKRGLLERYILDEYLGSYSLHPIVRASQIASLKSNLAAWQAAHSISSDFLLDSYRNTISDGALKLASSYAELRHHLLEANRLFELSSISERLTVLLSKSITKQMQSQVPKNKITLAERIALISCLPEDKRSNGMSYHLALCLRARNNEGDLEKALSHIRKAESKNIYYASWLLRLELEYRFNGIDAVDEVLIRYRRVSGDRKKAASVYGKAADLAEVAKRLDKAEAYFRQAVEFIPDECLVEIVPAYTRLLRKLDRDGAALTLLLECLDRPSITRVSTIYESASKLLLETGEANQALKLAERGLADERASKKWVLRLIKANILCAQNKNKDAVEFLQNSIRNTGKEDPIRLVEKCVELLTEQGRLEDAIGLFEKQLQRAQPKNRPAMYVDYAKKLEKAGRSDQAIKILEGYLQSKSGIDKTEAYEYSSNYYFSRRDLTGSIRILKSAIGDPFIGDKLRFYRDLADRYYREGNIEACLNVLNSAFIDPNCSSVYQAYMDASKYLSKEERIEDAIDVLEEGLKAPAVGDRVAIALELSKRLYTAGNLNRSESVLSDILKDKRANGLWRVYKNLAELLAEQGKVEEAGQVYNEAIESAKSNNKAAIYISYAKFLWSTEDISITLQFLQSAIEDLPNNQELKNIRKYIEIEKENENTFDEVFKRIEYLKQKIENENLYRAFYNKTGSLVDDLVSEETIQQHFKLVWANTKSKVNAEVGNGQGYVDFQITRGYEDTTVVEFKLAKNSSLMNSVPSQVKAYARANETIFYYTVILFFNDKEKERSLKLLDSLEKEERNRVILIDATVKLSASKLKRERVAQNFDD
ncbi:tetratricopeptide repeat protein [Dasania sp. GY-MA-18]|uniref:Tetratricopeptide repeat protein n=1 Tax=Dasania phycosphaerae TaxID=2950436 RepID=A0A9J6RRC9_9GAMM|nr:MULTISPECIES: tetratricopeptide repeat protein [Dasania]MCR8924464.1 tetratricopeptide repeat protein [Dasania sp. GY-MA-18]MCZ0867139.1 tetratricopeptide repeat protein [Dasania phycosphaerae]MCZ0870591.1 tetratricopeptide repeat protein [Dasania phycosphaerae]